MPIMTSVDLITAVTFEPFLRPRVFTELMVMTEAISWPPAMRTITSAVTTPFLIRTIVPGSWLRALSCMVPPSDGSVGVLADEVCRPLRAGPGAVHGALRQHQAVAGGETQLAPEREERHLAAHDPDALVVIVQLGLVVGAGGIGPLEHRTKSLPFEAGTQRRGVDRYPGPG